MNGRHGSSLHHLSVLLMIISGSALPTIDYALYRRKIPANLTSRRNSADDWMPLTQNQIGNIFLTENQFIDLLVSLKTKTKKFLFRLRLNQPSINSLPT